MYQQIGKIQDTYLKTMGVVPVIEIDGKGIVGFHKDRIKKRILESLING